MVSPGAEEKPSLEVLPLGLVNQSKGEGERKTSSVPAVCENQGLKGVGLYMYVNDPSAGSVF